MATFYGQVFGSAKTSASGGGTYASGLRTVEQLKDLKGRTLSVRVVAE